MKRGYLIGPLVIIILILAGVYSYFNITGNVISQGVFGNSLDQGLVSYWGFNYDYNDAVGSNHGQGVAGPKGAGCEGSPHVFDNFVQLNQVPSLPGICTEYTVSLPEPLDTQKPWGPYSWHLHNFSNTWVYVPKDNSLSLDSFDEITLFVDVVILNTYWNGDRAIVLGKGGEYNIFLERDPGSESDGWRVSNLRVGVMFRINNEWGSQVYLKSNNYSGESPAIVSTYDGENIIIYINGVKDSEMRVPGELTSSSDPRFLAIGRGWFDKTDPGVESAEYLSGSNILNVGIWDRALNETEVARLYYEVDGICVSAELCECVSDSSCDDNNSCTTDSCSRQGVCEFVDNSISCDDGNFCTSNDTCSQGVCTGSSNSLSCNDENPCTLNDICSAGFCGGVQNTCNDNLDCSIDSCNLDNGLCINKKDSCPCANSSQCDDNNPCTDNTCSSAGQCITTNNIAICTDNNNCTINDTCAQGSCVGIQKPLDDGVLLTLDRCLANGTVTHTTSFNLSAHLDSQSRDLDASTNTQLDEITPEGDGSRIVLRDGLNGSSSVDGEDKRSIGWILFIIVIIILILIGLAIFILPKIIDKKKQVPSSPAKNKPKMPLRGPPRRIPARR